MKSEFQDRWPWSPVPVRNRSGPVRSLAAAGRAGAGDVAQPRRARDHAGNPCRTAAVAARRRDVCRRRPGWPAVLRSWERCITRYPTPALPNSPTGWTWPPSTGSGRSTARRAEHLRRVAQRAGQARLGGVHRHLPDPLGIPRPWRLYRQQGGAGCADAHPGGGIRTAGRAPEHGVAGADRNGDLGHAGAQRRPARSGRRWRHQAPAAGAFPRIGGGGQRDSVPAVPGARGVFGQDWVVDNGYTIS